MSFVSKWEFNTSHHGDGMWRVCPPLFPSSVPWLHRRLRVNSLFESVSEVWSNRKLTLQEQPPGSISAVNTTNKRMAPHIAFVAHLCILCLQTDNKFLFQLFKINSFLILSCIGFSDSFIKTQKITVIEVMQCFNQMKWLLLFKKTTEYVRYDYTIMNTGLIMFKQTPSQEHLPFSKSVQDVLGWGECCVFHL